VLQSRFTLFCEAFAPDQRRKASQIGWRWKIHNPLVVKRRNFKILKNNNKIFYLEGICDLCMAKISVPLDLHDQQDSYANLGDVKF
jgi:hypothetical protein